MALIYLIRHAQTEMQPGVPSAEWPLSARGQKQAESLARLGFWADVGTVYVSPEGKAVATARPALKRHALPLVMVEDLRELSRPIDDMLTQEIYVETAAACFASPDESVRGWEQAGAAQRRIRDAIATIAADAIPPGTADSPSSAAVVSHGLVLSLFLASLAGRPAPTVAEWRSIPMPGWAAVDSETWRLVEPFASI